MDIIPTNPYDEIRGCGLVRTLPKKRVMLRAVKSTGDGSMGKQEWRRTGALLFNYKPGGRPRGYTCGGLLVEAIC